MSERENRVLAIGTRVKMSLLGAARCRRLVNKIGTIVFCSTRYSSVGVLFDGNKSLTSLHRDYVEPQEDEGKKL